LHGEECATRIYVEGFVEVLGRYKRRGYNFYERRVSNNNVQSSFLSFDGCVKPVKVRQTSNVALHGAYILAYQFFSLV
jgi:hypothetical protein